MTNPKEISEKLAQIRHYAIELQSQFSQISTDGLNDEDQTALLVSLATCYRDTIDMLKKNADVSFDQLKRKGLQALDQQPGSTRLPGLQGHDAVRVVVSDIAADPEGHEQMSMVRLHFHD